MCPDTNNTAACEQTFPGEWIYGRIDGQDPPRVCKVGHKYAESSYTPWPLQAFLARLTAKEIERRGEGSEWDLPVQLKRLLRPEVLPSTSIVQVSPYPAQAPGLPAECQRARGLEESLLMGHLCPTCRGSGPRLNHKHKI